MEKNNPESAVYISYAWNSESESVAEAIEKELVAKGIRIIRDKKDLKYKGRIKDFMAQIGKGQYVIVVISNKYLKSENCMFELLQIFKNRNFYDRIFPVVLKEVKIAKASDRVAFVEYWQDERENLDKRIRKLKSLSNIQGVTEELNLYTEIRNNIAVLTNILQDINTLNTDKHIRSNFEHLYDVLYEKMREDRKRGRLATYDAISAIGLSALMIIAIGFSLLGNMMNPTIQEEQISDGIDPLAGTEIEKTDQESGVTNASGTMQDDAEKKVTPVNPNPTEIVKYMVTLVIPSSMIGKDIYVDGKLVSPSKENGIFVDIEVPSKEGSHRFEIKEGNGEVLCAKSQSIKGSGIELAVCN